MSQRRARDRSLVIAVEADVGRSSFDGNHTNDVTSWLIAFENQVYVPLDDADYRNLMEWTMAGHLAWVVFTFDNLDVMDHV